MSSSEKSENYIISPEGARLKRESMGIPEDVWEHHIATNGLNHWARTYMHTARGLAEKDIFEVFTELNKDDPLFDERLTEMREYLTANNDDLSQFRI